MEPPKTLDDVRAAKGVFPADEIEPGDAVLDLMCAGFWGANAAIHAINRGATLYAGIDIDAQKLDVMRAIYPDDRCIFEEVDAVEMLEIGILIGKRSPVVICDPWTQQIADWMPRLLGLLRVTGRVLILGTCNSWLIDNDREPTPESMTAWAKTLALEAGRIDSFPTCTRVIRRSDHLGGTFWTVWR